MSKWIHGTIEFQTLSAKTLVFHLVGPFRIAKRPFLGLRFLGMLSRVCVHGTTQIPGNYGHVTITESTRA